MKIKISIFFFLSFFSFLTFLFTSLTFSYIDLIPINISANSTKIIIPNSGTATVQFSAEIKNDGNSKSSSFYITWYLSPNCNLLTGGNNQILGETLVSEGISANSTSIISSGILDITSNYAGSEFCPGIFVDSKSQISEKNSAGASRENNNLCPDENGNKLCPIPEKLFVYSIDLIPTNATFTVPTSINTNNILVKSKPATFFITIANKGVGYETGNFKAKLYASSDSSFNINDNYLGEFSISSILSPTDKQASSTFTLPDNFYGNDIYFIVIADPSNEITEINEGNNIFISPKYSIYEPEIDIIPQEIKTPAFNPTAGINIPFSVKLQNSGNTPSGGFDIDWYLSLNSTITTSDTKLKSIFIQNLAGGNVEYSTQEITIPACKDNGTEIATGSEYFFGIIADSKNSIDEKNENNNALSSTYSLVVYAEKDALIKELTFPLEATAGENINFNVYLENSGVTDTCLFDIAYFLCDSKTSEYTDNKQVYNSSNCWKFSTSSSISNLSGGSSSKIDVASVVPQAVNSTSPQSRWLIACADFDEKNLEYGQIIEKSESNNCYFSDKTIKINPPQIDLYALPFYLPDVATQGEEINFSVSITNTGIQNSGEFKIKWVLDTLEGSIKIDNILPKETLVVPIKSEISCSQPIGNYYMKIYIDSENSIPEQNEKNNLVESENEIEISKESYDFAIESVFIPPILSIKSLEEITATAQIKNNGNLTIPSNKCELKWLMSDNSIITESDYLLKAQKVNFTLKPQDLKQIQGELTIPCDFEGNNIAPCASVGEWYIGAIASCSEVENYLCQTEVSESNKQNNKAISDNKLIVQHPIIDLYPTEISSIQKQATDEISLLIKYEIQKESDIGIELNVSFYLSNDNNLDATDKLIKEPQEITAEEKTYASSITTTFDLPINIESTNYFICAKLDSLNEISENIEDNNTICSLSSLKINTRSIDLIPVLTSVNPSYATLGENVTLLIQITNSGKSALKKGYYFLNDIYLSKDATIIETEDYLINTIKIELTEDLPPDSSILNSISTTLPSSLKTGSYYIAIKVDSSNLITEISTINNAEENNISNTKIITVNPSGDYPDIVGDKSTLVYSKYVAAGGNFAGGLEVTNNSIAPAGRFSIAWYLSQYSTISQSDILLGITYVESIEQNSKRKILDSLTVPTTLVSGKKYYLRVELDAGNEIYEGTGENNNTIITDLNDTQVTIINQQGDLTVSKNTTPSSAKLGEIITLSSTVNYSGNGSCSNFTISYFLSKDKVIDPFKDINLGNYYVSNSLKNEGIINSFISAEIPTYIEITDYYAGAYVDSLYDCPETNETNNSIPANYIKISAPTIDITGDYINVPTFASAGKYINISTTFRNTQISSSGDFNVNYYLSDNKIITSEDILLGQEIIKSISGKNTSIINTKLQIPATIKPNFYYIGVTIDPDNIISEIDENNNIIVSTTTLFINKPQIDLTPTSITIPQSAPAGTKIKILITIENAGLEESGNFAINFYLSKDTIIDDNDLFLSSYQAQSILGMSGKEYYTFVKIPENANIGLYYLLAFVDENNYIIESNKNNNVIYSEKPIIVETKVATGKIKVESSPDGAKIIIDGEDTGYKTSSEISDIPVGSHIISVQLFNYTCAPYSQLIEVEKDKTTVVPPFKCELNTDFFAEKISLSDNAGPTGKVEIKVYLTNVKSPLQAFSFGLNYNDYILQNLQVEPSGLASSFSCYKGANGIVCYTENSQQSIQNGLSGEICKLTWTSNCSNKESITNITISNVQLSDSSGKKGTVKEINSSTYRCTLGTLDLNHNGILGDAGDINKMIQCIVEDIDCKTNSEFDFDEDGENGSITDFLILLNFSIGNCSSVPPKWKDICGK